MVDIGQIVQRKKMQMRKVYNDNKDINNNRQILMRKAHLSQRHPIKYRVFESVWVNKILECSETWVVVSPYLEGV